MLTSLILLAAPFLPLPASAAFPDAYDLGPGESVEVECQGATTVTETVYLPAPSNTPESERANAAAPLAVLEETEAPVSSPVPSPSPLPNWDQTSTFNSTAASFSNITAKLIPGYRNALYFTNWGIYGADFQPQQLPADKVTHVLYAFADIGSDGEVKSSDPYSDLEKHYPTDSWNDEGNNAYGCVKQLYILKKKHRQLKTLLSIGGWTYSPKFAPVAATEAGRKRFCDSAVMLLKDWGFDGLDIDWEYPTSPTQAEHYVLLLKTCRAALDVYASKHAGGHHFLLTIAAPAGPQNYNTLDIPAMDPFLDAWHLMAYDYAGSWDSTTGHQANIFLAPTDGPPITKFSTERAVTDYLGRGVPSRKLILGLPLYGRAFDSTKGLGLPYAGVGEGSLPGQPGVWLYRDLPREGAQERYDHVAKASYSFDEKKGELVSYDNVGSARAKAEYLVQRGLGGAVFWEASGDKVGDGSLVGAVAERIGQVENAGKGEMVGLEREENWLGYPDSKYENIRKGVPGG